MKSATIRWIIHSKKPWIYGSNIFVWNVCHVSIDCANHIRFSFYIVRGSKSKDHHRKDYSAPCEFDEPSTHSVTIYFHWCPSTKDDAFFRYIWTRTSTPAAPRAVVLCWDTADNVVFRLLKKRVWCLHMLRLYCLVHPSIWHTWPSGEWPWILTSSFECMLSWILMNLADLALKTQQKWVTWQEVPCFFFWKPTMQVDDGGISLSCSWFHPVAIKGMWIWKAGSCPALRQLYSCEVLKFLMPNLGYLLMGQKTSKVNGTGVLLGMFGVIVGGFVTSLRSWANPIFYGLSSC